MAIYKLKENRVYRPFLGGKLLDEWQGRQDAADGNYPERWVASTVVATDGTGLSQTEDGRLLRDVIRRDLDVLVKVLDSCSRLMIQTHPTDVQSQKYCRYPYGKTECWYILGTRKIGDENPYVLLGFKEGITREKWIDLFNRQDISAMIGCLNKIEVKKGDCFFVPANVPHAMGGGVFFAEAQQPTDITFRMEYVTPAGKRLEDRDLHGGAGFDAMFDCFAYVPSKPGDYMVMRENDTVISNDFFSITQAKAGSFKVGSYAIVLMMDGEGEINDVPVKRADELYIDEDFTVTGDAEILIFTGKDKMR